MTIPANLNIVDFVLIAVMAAFVLSGLWWGIIHMLGSIAGYAIGAFAAGRLYERTASWLAGIFGGSLNTWRIVAFILILVVVIRLVGLVVSGIDAAFKFLSIIPFLTTFNRLLGAAFGFVEGVLVLSIVTYFAARFPITQGFAAMLATSTVAQRLNAVGTILAALLPLAVRLLKSVFSKI